jgi:hypothetical protein
MPAPSRYLNFALLLGLAWAVTAGFLLAERWPEMGERLFDGDDAMRLVQVREFLAGRGWFDLHEARLAPPTGYDTHWSRLIDAGLAGLFLAFRPFADLDLAERLMRAVWPLLWLLVAMAGAAALAWRLAGRQAAVIVLVLSACALPAFQHYKPGRIDHHNVQIALALAVVAATAWADRTRHAATLAGILTGLASAVGFESLPLLVLCASALALRFIWTGNASARSLAHYGLAVAAGVLAAFLLNVAPDHWSRPACDAIAVNWLVAAMVAGLGFWVAARAPYGLGKRRLDGEPSTPSAGRPMPQAGARTIAIALVGGAALLAFLLFEPRCIHGPFALTDDAVKAIWLDDVDESVPLVAFVRGFPVVGAWICTFPLVALLAALALARDGETRRDFGFLLAVAACLLSVAATFGAMKIYAYAMWFGMPPVAALACRLTASSGLRASVIRVAAIVALTPTVATTAALAIALAAAGEDPAKPGIPERMICTRNDAYEVLARLPPGLVATDVNYGPYVLALTPHAVVAAPYHRLPAASIVAAYAIFSAPPEEARRIAESTGVTYIAVCGRRTSTGMEPSPGSLRAELSADRVPAWLEQFPETRGAPYAVYRLRH